MNVLFLDIDGVLNHCGQTIWAQRRQDAGEFKIDYHNKEVESRVNAESCPIAVSNLKLIIEAVPQLKIVVHSNWTSNRDWDFIEKFFTKLGFDTKDWETTPKKFSSEKTHEIGFWLHDYKDDHNDELPKFKVVDDKSWAYQGLHSEGAVYLIDPRVGLTYIDAVNLIEFYNPEWEEPVMAF